LPDPLIQCFQRGFGRYILLQSTRRHNSVHVYGDASGDDSSCCVNGCGHVCGHWTRSHGCHYCLRFVNGCSHACGGGGDDDDDDNRPHYAIAHDPHCCPHYGHDPHYPRCVNEHGQGTPRVHDDGVHNGGAHDVRDGHDCGRWHTCARC
jgi:hypothetical protein